MVDEPTVEDTISILRGFKERYEVFHGVKITDSALVSAAVLSNRYISVRFSGSDDRVQLIDKQDDLSVRIFDVIENRFQTLLKFTTDRSSCLSMSCTRSSEPEKRTAQWMPDSC